MLVLVVLFSFVSFALVKFVLTVDPKWGLGGFWVWERRAMGLRFKLAWQRAVFLAAMCLVCTLLSAQAALAAAPSTSTTSTTQQIFVSSVSVDPNSPLIQHGHEQVIGKFNGVTVYDQTVDAVAGDPAFLASYVAARNAIIAAAGASVTIQEAISSSSTSNLPSTTVTTYSLASSDITFQSTLQVGPSTVLTGQRSVCTGIASLPSTSLPTCASGFPTPFTVVSGSNNVNINTDTTYNLNKNSVVTRNFLNSVVKVLTGTPIATNGISFAPIPTLFSGYVTYNLVANASSGLAVVFASSTPAVCAVSGNQAVRVAAAGGTCTIVASQPGNATIPAATPVSQSFAWAAAAVGTSSNSESFSITQFITPAAAAIRNDSFSTQIIGTLNGTTVYSQTFPAAYADATAQAGVASARAAVAAAGGLTVTIASPALTSHNETSVSSTSVVSDVVQSSVQAVSGQLDIGPAVIIVGDRGVCSFGGSQDNFPSGCSSGIAANIPNGSSNINININTAQQILRTTTTTNNILTSEVYVIIGTTPNANIITFAALTSRAIGSGPVSISASASSGLTVTFSSATPAICSVAGSSVSLLSVGTCTITAKQVGNASFVAAADVNQSFTISQATQTIAFTSTPPSQAAIGGPTYTATSTGGASGNAVTFTIDAASNGACTLVGSVVSFIKPGTCIVNANQAGNANYAAAVQVQQSMMVVNDAVGPTAQAMAGFMGDRANQILMNLFDMRRTIDRLDNFDQTVGQTEPGGQLTGSSENMVASSKGDLFPSTRLGAGSTVLPVAAAPSTQPMPDLFGLQQLAYSAMRQLGEQQSLNSLNYSGPFNATLNNGPAGLNGSFHTSLSQMDQWGQQYEQQQSAALGLKSSHFGAYHPSRLDVWLEGVYANVNSTQAANFGMISTGADYVVNRNVLLGVFSQFDFMAQTSGQHVGGSGWMAGPYATLRLTDHMFFEARGAYGRSSNTMIDTLVPAATDSFTTSRWLASAALAGQWQIGENVMFKPNFSFAYYADSSDPYMNAALVSIPSVTTQLGQLKFSPELSNGFVMGDGTRIEASITPELIYNLTAANVAGIGALAPQSTGPQGLRGAVKIGFGLRTQQGINLSANGTYDGIGSDGYSAWAGRVQMSVPLN